jgi:hypothetical protein
MYPQGIKTLCSPLFMITCGTSSDDVSLGAKDFERYRSNIKITSGGFLPENYRYSVPPIVYLWNMVQHTPNAFIIRKFLYLIITPGSGTLIFVSAVVASSLETDFMACAARTALSKWVARTTEVAPVGAAVETHANASSAVITEMEQRILRDSVHFRKDSSATENLD